jgi:hypothetical protein
VIGGCLRRLKIGSENAFLVRYQKLEIKRQYENIEGAIKAGREELIYTSYKDSRAFR